MFSEVVEYIKEIIPGERARTITIALIWLNGLQMIFWNIFVVMLYGDEAPTISEVTRDYAHSYPFWGWLLGVFIGHWLLPGIVQPFGLARAGLLVLGVFIFIWSYQGLLPSGAIKWFLFGLPCGCFLWAMLPPWATKELK